MIARNPILAPTLFNSISQMLNHALENFEETSSYNSDHQLYSTDSGWVLRIDAPGLEKQDIVLKYQEEALHISAENAEFDLEKTFTLGNDVDIENIKAKLEDGVLELTLPKTNKSKTINIL